jgi:hypothetical protein
MTGSGATHVGGSVAEPGPDVADAAMSVPSLLASLAVFASDDSESSPANNPAAKSVSADSASLAAMFSDLNPIQGRPCGVTVYDDRVVAG